MPAEYSDLFGAFIRDDSLRVLYGYTRQCVVHVFVCRDDKEEVNTQNKACQIWPE